MRTIHTHVDESQKYCEVNFTSCKRMLNDTVAYKNLKLAEQNHFNYLASIK